MQKIKITADAVLGCIQDIFSLAGVNAVITGADAPQAWQNRTITDILNVEYFSFKHRPASSDAIIGRIKRKGQNVNELLALDRGFCSVFVTGTERQFQNDVDVVGISATLEYWVQTPKIKLLEQLVENANIAANGIRLVVNIDGAARQAVIIFDEPSVADIQAAQGFGEMAIIEVGVSIILYPQVTSYADYTVTFGYTDGGTAQTATIPLNDIGFSSDYSGRPVPQTSRPSSVGSLNLSRTQTLVVTFDGWASPFIDWLAAKSFAALGGDINESLSVTISRKGVAFAHNMVIQRHEIVTSADTTNERHTLNLTTRGAL